MNSLSRITGVTKSWHLLLLGLILIVPILVLFSYIDSIDFAIFTHARLGLLTTASINSLIHLSLTLLGTMLIGVPLAWLSAVCRFTGMESFWWALILPIAMPTFALAGVYEQTSLVTLLDIPYRMAIYSTLSLYPLVYLIMRIAFESQNGEYIDGSRCLGFGVWKGLWRVGFSMNRPALVASLLLVAMEVLSDVATPRLLNFRSIPYSIFTSASQTGSEHLAVELTSLMVLFFLMLLWFDHKIKGRRRYHQVISGFRRSTRMVLTPSATALSVVVSLAVLIAALLFPLMTLVTAPPTVSQPDLQQLAQPILVSFFMAICTALLVSLLATLISYGLRYNPSLPLQLANWLPAMALVIPGSVLAFLIITPLERIDTVLSQMLQPLLDRPVPTPLASSFIPMIYILTIKFLAFGSFAIRAAILTTSDSMDQASRSLGRNAASTFIRIHIPLLLPMLAGVFFLVFAEALKEAAIVLVLIPDGYQTLVQHALESVETNGLASSSRAIVLIISLALIPAILMVTIINLRKL